MRKKISNKYQFQMSNVKSKFIGNCKLEIRNWKFQRGFTLIELIVVITIIAILVGAISISWAKAQQKARDARRKNDLKAVQQALDTYYDLTGRYPRGQIGWIWCGTLPGTSPAYSLAAASWGNSFTCTQTDSNPPNQQITFMQQVPKDPVFLSTSDPKQYYYTSVSPYKTYILSAYLENTNDPENTSNPNYVPGTLPCTPAGGRNYCVKNQ